MNKYCFKINNPSSKVLNIKELKEFVQNLYTGDGDFQFKPNEKIPFVVIYSEEEDNVCISMTSSGKKNNDRVSELNDKLSSKSLKWKDGITLSKPLLYQEDAQDWFGDIGPGTRTGPRWKTLVQQGPYFTHLMVPYVSLGISLLYEGKKYPLNIDEEQIAIFYAKRLISEASGGVVDDWTKDTIFQKNYWDGFKTYLTKDHKSIFKDFSKINWSDAVSKVEAIKENGMTIEDLRMKKVINEEKKHRYGFAILDGKREKVGNFTVEPASIFYGRGANPNRGKVKREIFPEDVTINIGEKDPVPTPPYGHTWGAVVHDHKAVWLAKWKDTITDDIKYVQFAAEGRFKGESDLEKYEKARKLQRHIETVREKYMVDASSNSTVKKQLGTVLWLIDNYGVRVGGEKGTDEADTVGATTLRVEHMKLEKPNKVIFDFLGKDSIRFYKELLVPKIIFTNFEFLIKGKIGNTQVFNDISSRSVNIYLKEFDKNFSAKVFRTRLGSSIMFEALKNVKIPKGSSNSQIKILFNKANIKVAEVLNHTRNISKKAKEGIDNDKDKLKDLNRELKDKTKEGKSTLAIEKRIEAAQARIESKTDVMAVAITTSLTNYIDPRLVVAWSTKESADLDAIYSKALSKKFQWAINTTPKNWNWLSSTLQGNQEMEPSEDAESGLVTSEEDKPIKKTVVPKVKIPKVVIPKVVIPKVVMPNVVIPKVVIPKVIPDIISYKLLLQICKNPKLYLKNLSNISKEAMDWIYPFSLYAIENNNQSIMNKFVVTYYNRAYNNNLID
jgi:DNA topoisomerase-1